jgi:iron complex transport system substrate-binding protein
MSTQRMMRNEARRIVCLTASLTEIIYALGLADRLAGVTDTCDYPQSAETKPNVGCWFEPDVAKLLALEPDLVLGSTAAHSRLRPELEAKGIQMMLSDPSTVEEALTVMTSLGERLGAAERAQACVHSLQKRLQSLDAKVKKIPISKRLTTARVLDLRNDRLIVAGPLSFQYDVIARGGGLNVSRQLHEAYPKVSFARFCQWDPEMVFFCGSDHAFIPRLANDPNWRRLRAGQAGRLYQFDCGLTCRTGPRIVDMAELLFETLYETW